ncbi:hypothetical protein LGR54_20190 [Ancylobacter sp. Lp-2]|uniref:hypothetical protein n=1 Tax=Ancylobacter sp. Lp-2 TaxID=2881339 RepID=UPI001E3DE1F2|nr:hypothetical protein [Ancylobacter sp. Lp-2]MCB4770935.1 hypothetical protein [Ancylobacter sp. Lp-2]
MLLRFETQNERSNFFTRVRQLEPKLEGFLRASYSQPTVVTVRVDDQRDQQRLLSIARQGATVKIFDDVPFTPLGAR